MTTASGDANPFLAHRYTVDRSMDRLEMLALGGGFLVAVGLCFIPNTIVQTIAAVLGSVVLARLSVGLIRRKKDSAWPLWLDADGISTLDDQGLYTWTRWSDVLKARIVKTAYDYTPYQLRLELHSHDVVVYSIPGPADQPFHAALKEHAGERLVPEVVPSADLPTSSIDMILKARELSARVGDEYLKKCKGMTRSQVGNALNADVPLVVSPEAEREFLQSHPDLAKIESLIRDAIRLEEQDSGPTSAYNVANGYNQLGGHYVFVQDFDKAIEAIQAALQRLVALRAVNPMNPAIVGEIATAHFNLGDVYATLYRKSGNPADRESARRHYQESMTLDRSQKADCRLTVQRLKSL